MGGRAIPDREARMGWVFLVIAAGLEIGWAVGLRYTHGWRNLGASAAVVAAYLLCLVFLSAATRTIPVSVAYAIWVGLGIAGVAALDTLAYGQPTSAFQLACIALILAGAIGLKVLT
jgi:quaternary ammonium compound-resistance protein SugE